MSDVTVCIYCPTKSDKPFSKAEHVIPQAFGKFNSREGNLTLHNVCPECNAYFGQRLEQHFGRDTGDAFFRLLAGVKPAEEAAEVGGRRLTFRIDEPGTEFHGSWMTLVYDPEHQIAMDAPPQVAFRGPFEPEWRWYLERDLTIDRLPEFRKCQFRIFGPKEDIARILEKMRAIGVTVEQSTWTELSAETQHPKLETVEVRYAVDDIVFRAVAKIAFNYLTKMTEERVPGFVRREEFTEIRAFIRHGIKPNWNPVSIATGKMLLGDTRGYRITNGHLLGVSWPDPNKVPVGKVSLFNQITYVVQFTDRVPGIWWELDAGHHFDITTRAMSKLASVNPLVLRA